MAQKRFRHQLTEPFMWNCWFFVISLLLRKKIVAILWVYPYHLMGLTRNANVVHFKDDLKKKRFYPFWFSGYVEARKLSTISSRYKVIPVYGHSVETIIG